MGRLVNTADINNVLMHEKSNYGIFAVEIDRIISGIVSKCPTIEQEPKTGRWMIVEDSIDQFFATYECSCCKRAIIVPHDAMKAVYKDYPYCHCGAKMQESEDQE